MNAFRVHDEDTTWSITMWSIFPRVPRTLRSWRAMTPSILAIEAARRCSPIEPVAQALVDCGSTVNASTTPPRRLPQRPRTSCSRLTIRRSYSRRAEPPATPNSIGGCAASATPSPVVGHSTQCSERAVRSHTATWPRRRDAPHRTQVPSYLTRHSLIAVGAASASTSGCSYPCGRCPRTHAGCGSAAHRLDGQERRLLGGRRSPSHTYGTSEGDRAVPFRIGDRRSPTLVGTLRGCVTGRH